MDRKGYGGYIESIKLVAAEAVANRRQEVMMMTMMPHTTNARTTTIPDLMTITISVTTTTLMMP